MEKITKPSFIDIAFYESALSIARSNLNCKTNKDLKSMCESILYMLDYIKNEEEE